MLYITLSQKIEFSSRESTTLKTNYIVLLFSGLTMSNYRLYKQTPLSDIDNTYSMAKTGILYTQQYWVRSLVVVNGSKK